MLHFIEVIKLVYDDNSITLVWFDDDDDVACLQAVTGGFIAENPFRSLIERHLGFLRRALPGTSGRAQKSREGGG